jgi:hypothetical protein
MHANLLENKQNLTRRSAAANAGMESVPEGQRGNKGVEEFARGSPALRLQTPARHLVRCLKREVFARGHREEAPRAGRGVGSRSAARAALRSIDGIFCASAIAGECRDEGILFTCVRGAVSWITSAARGLHRWPVQPGPARCEVD